MNNTVRLWDSTFTFLATENIPDTAIDDNGDQIEIAITDDNSPIRQAIVAGHKQAGQLPNLHITIDDDPTDPDYRAHRRGGIIREISFHAGTLVLLIAAHSRTQQQQAEPETIYPPRGYGIGLPGGGDSDHAIIGCWATEDEARQAIGTMRVFTLGDARPSWDTTR